MSEKKKAGRPPKYHWKREATVMGTVKSFGRMRKKNGAYVAVPTEWVGHEVAVISLTEEGRRNEG